LPTNFTNLQFFTLSQSYRHKQVNKYIKPRQVDSNRLSHIWTVKKAFAVLGYDHWIGMSNLGPPHGKKKGKKEGAGVGPWV